MKVKKLPLKRRLKQLFVFDASTGEIRWKQNRGGCKAGDLAGYVLRYKGQNKKYRVISVDGIDYRAHRLMYFYFYGTQPKEIDHANGDYLDNRLSNLRAGTNKVNQNNRSKDRNNTSGVTGVSFRQSGNLWLAEYGGKKFQRKHKTRRMFKDFFEAVCCRKSWECKFGMAELKKHRNN